MQDAKLYGRSDESNDTEIITLDRAAYNQGKNAKYDFSIIEGGVVHTLVARGPGAVCYKRQSVRSVQQTTSFRNNSR